MTTAVLMGASVLLLRGDVVSLLRQPKESLYGEPTLKWSWGRSVLGLFLAPLLLVGPILYGVSLIQINFRDFGTAFLTQSTVVQALYMAFAYELFFRETALKAFGGAVSVGVLASSLAYFTMFLPHGFAEAMIAVGCGLFFMSLRLIGMNILLVALVSAANTLFWSQLMTIGVTGETQMTYAAYFLGYAGLVSLVLYYLFGQREREFVYA
ncbi:MAG: hypothetical protein GJ676_01255 [Rhodobacteraceae bacterium]|nr:hypothetical protein [Paracoccaceae bacterium]